MLSIEHLSKLLWFLVVNCFYKKGMYLTADESKTLKDLKPAIRLNRCLEPTAAHFITRLVFGLVQLFMCDQLAFLSFSFNPHV